MIKGAGAKLNIWPCEQQGKSAFQTFAVNREKTAITKIGRVLPAVVLSLAQLESVAFDVLQGALEGFQVFRCKKLISADDVIGNYF